MSTSTARRVSKPCAEGIAARIAQDAATKAEAARRGAVDFVKALKLVGDTERAAIVRAMLPALEARANATEEAAQIAFDALHKVQSAYVGDLD